MYDCFGVPSSVLRALPITFAEMCTFQVCLLALALLHAALLAFAGDELPANLGCLRECCPVGLVSLVARLDPAPVGLGGQCWCRKQSLAPAMSPWYTARRTCCLRAALVGGISWTLFFLATVSYTHLTLPTNREV